MTIKRTFRGAVYTIHVTNPNGHEKGAVKMTVDGKEVAGNLVPYVEGKKEYSVEYVM